MPQLDKITFLSQIFWIFLLSFYFYILLIFIKLIKFINIKKLKSVELFSVLMTIFLYLDVVNNTLYYYKKNII